MTRRTRIGAVSYLNTRPLVHGLDQGLGAERIELSYAVPAVLADQLAAGELDVALLPVIELGRIPDLEIAPGLGITTHGPCRSVLLVSRVPFDSIHTLALDLESRTSNALGRVLLAERWSLLPEVVAGRPGLQETLQIADAAIRIGDKALFDDVDDLDGLHVADLGQVWTERTGLPFVFAAWTARRGVIDRELYKLLHASRRAGTAALEQIVQGWQWKGQSHPDIVREYLTRHIHFRLGSAELQAIRSFLGAAYAQGIVEQPPDIHLALERWSACHEAARSAGPSEATP